MAVVYQYVIAMSQTVVDQYVVAFILESCKSIRYRNSETAVNRCVVAISRTAVNQYDIAIIVTAVNQS